MRVESRENKGAFLGFPRRKPEDAGCPVYERKEAGSVFSSRRSDVIAGNNDNSDDNHNSGKQCPVNNVLFFITEAESDESERLTASNVCWKRPRVLKGSKRGTSAIISTTSNRGNEIEMHSPRSRPLRRPSVPFIRRRGRKRLAQTTTTTTSTRRKTEEPLPASFHVNISYCARSIYKKPPLGLSLFPGVDSS
ncbi:uncharacterized protein LOC143207601 [Lasioglossum baleicum]|uniref:uncharacterized protein LOC143207601 n=1 Tax=Lasioglossum baleicum TaxID=434251 RepID=UPI003FCD7E9B